MSLAADPRFRSIRLAFANNDARGNEFVQLYAKIAGGEWALVRTFAVAGSEQVTTWDTALPVAAYALAMRYVSGNVPAVGYEGSPDDWSSPHAADSKTTVTTSSATVSWIGGAFVNAATPINLQWSSQQQDVPYLLEKSTNGGMSYTTVVAGLVATSYQYTIPGAELGNTTLFRVTAQRGAVAGPTAGVLSVPMFITVGQPTWSSATFSPTTRIASLAWNAASQALTYLLEKNPGSGWVTIGTVSATSYSYAVPDAEINTTVQFRVTGQNGSTSGTVSSSQGVAMTIVVGASVLSLSSAFDPQTGVVGFSWTAASNATGYRLQADFGSGYVTVGTFSTLSGSASFNGAIPIGAANTTVPFRVVAFNGPIDGTASNVVSVALTVNLGTDPGTPMVTSYAAGGTYGLGKANLSWTPATGDINSVIIQSGDGSAWGAPVIDGVASPPDPGVGFVSKYSLPQAAARVRVQYLGGAFVRYSGNVSLVWP